MSIRQLDTNSSDTIAALSGIPDTAAAIDLVLRNALEAKSSFISVISKPPFSSFSVEDDGVGIGLSTLLSIGFESKTLANRDYKLGKSLFWLSKVSLVKITSCSPLSGKFKSKRFGYDYIGDVVDEPIATISKGSLVEVQELFEISPVRKKHFLTSTAAQEQSIVKMLLETAASHPSVSFHWEIGGLTSQLSSKSSIFGRLAEIFSSFDSSLPWINIDLNGPRYSLTGVILSPKVNYEAIVGKVASRLMFFNRKRVSCPELFVAIDSSWIYYASLRNPSLNSLKRCPVFYLSIEGDTDEFEIFRSFNSSTSQLHCHNLSSIQGNFKSYFDEIFGTNTIEKVSRRHLEKKKNESRFIAPSERVNRVFVGQSELNQSLAQEHPSLQELWSERRENRTFSLKTSFSSIRPSIKEVRSSSDLNGLKIIGQAEKKFILALDPSGTLVAFDQHAVHERIRFEHLLRIISNPTHDILYPKILSEPLETKVSESDRIELEKRKNELEKWSWRFSIIQFNHEECSKSILIRYKLVVSYSPVLMGVSVNGKEILTHLEKLKSCAGGLGSNPIPDFAIDIAKSKACRGAIMFGDSIQKHTMENMIVALSHCKNPFACAHGRTNIAILGDT